VQQIETAAPDFGVETTKTLVTDTGDFDHAISAFAAKRDGGLIVLPDLFNTSHRELIVSLAAQYRLPAVYPFRYFAESGGLISDGVDTMDQFRRSASYVDRVLKGAKPGDLPVQAPRKYELVINLKTANVLGLNVPSSLLARADGVIE
jgi:putative ABC transport system substrate-binding protein